jgi:uncharacterized membrane protein (DUF441 family)
MKGYWEIERNMMDKITIVIIVCIGVVDKNCSKSMSLTALLMILKSCLSESRRMTNGYGLNTSENN